MKGVHYAVINYYYSVVSVVGYAIVLLIQSFTYDPEFNRFAFRDETHSKPLSVGFQFDMFQQLIKWHFNVFQLTSDLFIDINTLAK